MTIVIFATGILVIVDYNNVFQSNHPKMNIDFWTSYFAIVAAVLLPVWLYLRERGERLKSEEDVKEKDMQSIFVSGISNVRPHITIRHCIEDSLDVPTLLIENIGIGNATNIQFYHFEENNGLFDFKRLFIRNGNHIQSEITMRPNTTKQIEEMYYSNDDDGLVKHYEKMAMIYTNILGSEIHISIFEFLTKEEAVHRSFCSYNYIEPKIEEKTQLTKVIKDYANDRCLTKSVYKYEEFIEKLSGEKNDK